VASWRWTTFRSSVPEAAADGPSPAEFAAQRLLARTGVVFRRTIERERLPVPWRDMLRAMRAMESRGDVRGGRFVAGFSGEQYALPEAVEALRAVRRGRKAAEAEDGSGPAGAGPARPPVMVVASDPLNFAGILTPDERVASTARTTVRVA
jgi:ATP-dependent Lhr-like helicase